MAINSGSLLKRPVHENENTLRPIRETRGFIRRGRALVSSREGADLPGNEPVEGIRSHERSRRLGELAAELPRVGQGNQGATRRKK